MFYLSIHIARDRAAVSCMFNTYLISPYVIAISIELLHFITLERYCYNSNKQHNIFLPQIFVHIKHLVIFTTVLSLLIVLLGPWFNYI